MEYKKYMRKPFTVDAVEITEENMEECAKYIGDVKEEDGVRYILVDKRLVPNVTKVTVGYFMTRFKSRVGFKTRVFSPQMFRGEFVSMTPDLDEWLVYLDNAE